MSGQNVDASNVFIDTGVLLNYVQVYVERDKGAVPLIEESYERTISRTVLEEFERRCENRQMIYKDLIVFINQQQTESDELHPVYQYEVRDQDVADELPHNLTNNDLSHIQSLQERCAARDVDNIQKSLSEFRRKARKQRTKTKQSIDTICKTASDPTLIKNINNKIGNKPDSQILSDAVYWKMGGGTGTVVTLDQKDLIDMESEINEIIDEVHSTTDCLTIISSHFFS